MKITEAFWENKNLGKKTVEMIIESRDSVSEIKSAISRNEFDYSVAKISNQNSNALRFLQNNGFMFIESQLSFVLNARSATLDKFNHVGENIDFLKLNSEDDLDIVLDNITGETFSTDRIALDPEFGLRVANQRYKNWISNEFGKDGIDLFRISENNTTVGFIMAKNSNNGEINLLLGGIFSKFQGGGYGFNIVYQPIKHYLSEGKTILKTKVSSNNMEIIKFYISMGYRIEKIDYILIKHKNNIQSKS